MNHLQLREQLLTTIDHEPGQTTSDRYEAIDTIEVIDTLHSHGFEINQISGAYSKNIGHRDQKHTVSMINRDLKVGDDGTYARAIIHNSYNARAAFKLIAGMFRAACTNGLVFGKVGEVANLRQRHTGDTSVALEQIEQYLGKLPQMAQLVQTYKDHPLTEIEMERAVNAMTQLRQRIIWGSKFDEKNFAVDQDSVLEVLRQEDAKKDAWTVFNVIQEKVIKGGYMYKPFAHSSLRKAKGVRNIVTSEKINGGLLTTFHEAVITA